MIFLVLNEYLCIHIFTLYGLIFKSGSLLKLIFKYFKFVNNSNKYLCIFTDAILETS